MSIPVLVVDDHQPSANALARALSDEGYDSLPVTSGKAALAALADRAFDVVITDLRMDGMDGIDLLHALRTRDPAMPVILVTAHGTVDRAVEATRAGAFAFLTKPIRLPEFLVQIRNATEQRRLVRAAERVIEKDEILGRSAAILGAVALADRAASSEATVLITGESGTGKELFSRRIHRKGARRDRPFVAVNCGAIPDSLIEAELFGHARGAFTGATSGRPGLIESAHSGTLFLDEVGELSLGAQTRLLRFLQEGTIRRVGETRDRKVDVRTLAATHRDVTSAGFREDLYYRLNVIPIELPPLRARRDDIPPLLGAALGAACARQGRPVPTVTGPALKHLLRYKWPGNVRELFNLAERLAVLCVAETIGPADLPDAILSAASDTEAVALPEGDFDLTVFLDSIEQKALRRALERFDGVKAQAAASLGLDRNTFRYKLKKHGVED